MYKKFSPTFAYEMPRRCFRLCRDCVNDFIVEKFFAADDRYYDRFAGHWAYRNFSLMVKGLFWRFIDWWL